MAARLNPCHGCYFRKGCEFLPAWQQKVAGLGLRSVWFHCEKLAGEIRVGRRIEVLAPIAEYQGEYGNAYDKRAVKATITAVSKAHEFACVVDPGQISEDDIYADHGDVDRIRFWKFRRHTRIHQFLDEPDVTVCKNGNIKRETGCDYRKDKQSQCACKYMEDMEKLAHVPDEGTAW